MQSPRACRLSPPRSQPLFLLESFWSSLRRATRCCSGAGHLVDFHLLLANSIVNRLDAVDRFLAQADLLDNVGRLGNNRLFCGFGHLNDLLAKAAIGNRAAVTHRTAFEGYFFIV